jgi:phenylpropionate dioxygenase-like ring-hydroxylating dioxygenase large terminal subunit
MLLSCVVHLFLIQGVFSFQNAKSPLFKLHFQTKNALNIKSTATIFSSLTNENSITTNTVEKNDLTNDEFNWTTSWYPLVPIEYLDSSKPHKYTLLGMDLVVWKDSSESENFEPKKKPRKRDFIKNLITKEEVKDDNGQWRVFVDKCPHRLVPLSEGRVESDGSLLCSYHGWRFDGEGDCLSIPQISDSEYTNVKENPKSKCNSFPVKIINDVLWVWADSGPNAVLQSELTPVPVMPVVDADGNPVPEESIIYNKYNFRELPYGADYFLENVVDPAHVPVSHHNVVGNRYTGPRPINMKIKEPMTKDGFVMEDNTTRLEMKAPCLVSIDAKEGDGGARQILELYISPSKPGFSNHLGRLVLIKDEAGNVPTAFKMFTLPIPVWMNHLLAATFLNQDALFLHAQERNLYHDLNYKTSRSSDDEETHQTNPAYKNMVFTPASADKGVILFRDWLRLKAGGAIPFKGYQGMPPVNNEIVFDQWSSHTSKCKYCLDAHNNAKKVRISTAALAILVATCRPKSTLFSATTTGLFCGISFASHKIIGAFHKMEFSHAEND